MSGHFWGTTWGPHLYCSMIPSHISTLCSSTSSRALLWCYFLAEAFSDHSTLRTATLRCYSISTVLFLFTVLYYCWIIYIWEVFCLFHVSPTRSFMKQRYTARLRASTNECLWEERKAAQYGRRIMGFAEREREICILAEWHRQTNSLNRFTYL